MTKIEKEINELSETDQKVLEYLLANKREVYPPIREVCKKFQWGSTNTAWKHIERLKDKGFI